MTSKPPRPGAYRRQSLPLPDDRARETCKDCIILLFVLCLTAGFAYELAHRQVAPSGVPLASRPASSAPPTAVAKASSGTSGDAEQLHFQLPTRTRVYLTWSVRYGLSNQLYSHVNGLALALLLGVDGVILPPAVSRRTFNTTLAHLRDETLWLPQPLGTLLDVRRMAAHWRERHSIQLHEATSVVMTSQGAAYPRPLLTSARPAGESANCTVLPLAVPEFSTLVSTAAAARALLDAAQQDHSGTGGCVILRTESLFRGFYSNSTAGLQTIAAAGLIFSPYLESLAQLVADSIGNFNGMHLRVEPDMGLKPEVLRVVGRKELLPVFVWHMRDLGYNSTTPIYAASGLLSYGDSDSLHVYNKLLDGAGVLGGRLLTKEAFLPPQELEKLHSEQKALLDLLVLTRANKFVGTKRSAFSYLARELRLLAGRSAASSRLHPPQFGAFWQDGLMEIAG